MSRIILITAFVFLILGVVAYPQNSFIPLMLDYAFYQGKNSNQYLEIYVSVFQNNLQYAPFEGKYRAEYSLNTQILKGDSILNQQSQKTQSVIDSLPEIKIDKQFVSLFLFELPKDEYETKVIIVDENSGKIGEYLLKLEQEPISPDSLAISDIELANKISKEVQNSEFNKNTLCVIPNPSNTYSVIMPVLYYYAEIYNLKFSNEMPGEYVVRTYISNTNGEIVREISSKTHKKPGQSAVIVDGFNIVTLKGDVYHLNLEITDKQTNQTINQSKRFIFHKPDRKKIAEAQEETSSTGAPADYIAAYGYFTEEELDKEFEYARYIVTPEEKKIFKTLEIEGKKSFLANFWKRQDKAHSELYRSFKTDYFERLNLANNLFGSGKIEGWTTDRGRIILIHGKPDEFERHAMDTAKKPYEIWSYHKIEGGVIFIFADLQGFGEYELLHSTYSQELHNPDWERLVRRAESYDFDFDSDFGR